MYMHPYAHLHVNIKDRHRVQTPKVRHQVQTQVQDDEVATNIDMVVGMVVGMVVDMVVGMAKVRKREIVYYMNE